jgi:hypothetical protein
MKGLKREPRGQPRTHCYNVRLVLVTFSVSSPYQFVFLNIFLYNKNFGEFGQGSIIRAVVFVLSSW